jgi:hypothetical protein
MLMDPRAHSTSDSRHAYAYTPALHTSPPRTPPTTPPQPRQRTMRRWPPQPSVEDEKTALAREHLPPSVTGENSEAVPSRGSIDQEPLLIEVENRERRFVLLPDQDKTSSKSSGTSSTRPNMVRRERQRPPHPLVTSDFEEPEALPRRQPSPYAFTRTPSSNRTSAEYFLSPGTITPQAPSIPRPGPNDPPSRRSSPRREIHTEGTSSRSSPNRRSRDFSDEPDIEPKSAFQSRKKHVSFSRTGSEDRPFVHNHDFGDDEYRYSSQPASPLDPYPPRNSTKSSVHNDRDRPVPTGSARDNTLGEPTPLMSAPATKMARSESVYSGSPSLYEFSRDVAPPIESVWPPSPPHSPNIPSPGHSPRASYSQPGSRASSRSNSPVSAMFNAQQAPAMLAKRTGSGSVSATEKYSPTGYPYVEKVKPTRPTPLSTSMRQESVEELPKVHSPTPLRPSRSPLPYPVDDDHVPMPCESGFVPAMPLSGSRSLDVSSHLPPKPSKSPQRSSTDDPYSFSVKPKPNPSFKPELPYRHSTAEGLPQARASVPPPSEPVPAGLTVPKKESTPSSPKLSSKSSLSTIPLPTKLPPCPRKEYSRKYDDWYTVVGYSSFDICPTCLDEIIRPTPYRKYFTRAASRPPSVRTRCDFGSPWVRLAWLLTLKRQRPDLDLLYGLNAISAAEPECPGPMEAVGTWYGLKDDKGNFLPNFSVCPGDRKKIETLFPSLINILQRIPQTGSGRPERLCSVRTEARRFALYLDALDVIDEKARSERKIPDTRPLIELARSYEYKRECRRDTVLIDSTWHFIPSHPECTVCEECYDALIWPHVSKGSSNLANRFNKMLQPLPQSFNQITGSKNYASSCQLYSPRMRRVWERAVKDDDLSYLARKIRERRKVEEECRSRQRELQRLLDRGAGAIGKVDVYLGGPGDREAVKKELEAIEREWAYWE